MKKKFEKQKLRQACSNIDLQKPKPRKVIEIKIQDQQKLDFSAKLSSEQIKQKLTKLEDLSKRMENLKKYLKTLNKEEK